MLLRRCFDGSELLVGLLCSLYMEVGWNEHISNTPKNAKTTKNLEASCIALWKPDLNQQKDFERLVLFRNGVT